MQITTSGLFYLFTALLVASSKAVPIAAPDDQSTNQLDSYANIPITNDGDEIAQESPLALELLPPAAVASVPVYYMGSDGVAVPAENYKRRVVRKREADEMNPVKSADETMQTEETFFLVPSNCGNRRLGGRPARAYYARRYHKYPWNYH